MRIPPLRRRIAPKPPYVEILRAGRPVDIDQLLFEAHERQLTTDEIELIKLGLIDERRLNIHAQISAAARERSQ